MTQLPTSPHNIPGWTWKFANGVLNTMYTKPNVTGAQDVNLTIARPTNVTVPDGTYTPLTVRAALESNTSINKTIALTYIVVNPPCNRNHPTIIVTPDNGSGVGLPGQKLTYTVKVTNNDVGSSCPTSQIDLSAIILNNTNNAWQYAFGQTTFTTIAPGVTKSTKLDVTSPTTAPDGPKTITVTAQRPNGAPQTYSIIYNVVSAVPSITLTPTLTQTPTTGPTAQPTISQNNCGGIAGLKCPIGYTCQYQHNPPLPDELGICVIPSPRVTATPTIIPTIFPGNGLVNVVLGIDGIGKTPRITIGGNQNPINENKNLTLSLYSAETNTLTEGWDAWTFTYNPTSQKFENQLALSDSFPTGVYNAYVEGPGFLRARLPGSVTIVKGQTTNINSDNFYVITGNINDTDTSENTIDILDYTVIVSCSIYSQDTSLCDQDPNYATYSDLNDDGRVDEDDLTLFLKEFGNQGALLP